MIAVGIFAVCINAQSFGDLVMSFITFSWQWFCSSVQDWVNTKKNPLCFALLSIDFHAAAKVLTSEKTSKELVFLILELVFICTKCHVWRRASRTHGSDISSVLESLFKRPRRKFPLLYQQDLSALLPWEQVVLMPALILNLSLWKPIYRAVHKSVALTVLSHWESSLQCLFTTFLNRGNSKWSLGVFSVETEMLL